MDKILVWGIGDNFQEIYNALKWNEDIGNFEILAYISKDFGRDSYEGKSVIRPEQISNWGGYYIIVASNRYYVDIITYGVEVLKIDRKKFLSGEIFKIPCFNWKKYIQIYKSDISIVSEICYGGVISSKLGLPFCSPFVNVKVGMDRNDYEKLLNQLDYYMSITPTEKNMELYRGRDWTSWEGRTKFPMLWYDNILLHGFHYKSQEDFLTMWEKRRKRYNPSSVVVFKILYDEKDLEEFEKMQIRCKVGFYYKETDRNDIITIPFEGELAQRNAYAFGPYVNNSVKNGMVFSRLDIFKALLGEKDFKR